MKAMRMYWRLNRRFKTNWRLTLFVFLLSFLSLGLSLYQPYLISRFIDRVLIKGQKELVLPTLSFYLALTVAIVLLNILRQSISRYLEINHILGLRGVVLRHMRRIPITEFEKNGAGKYLELMGNDTSAIASFFILIFLEFTTLFFQIVVAVVIIFSLDWRLGLIAIASLPLTFGIPRILRAPLKDATEKVRTHNQDISSYLVEAINGSREIRAYGLEQWEQRRNDRMYKGLVKASTMEGMFRHLSGQTGVLIVAVTVTLLYAIGSNRVAEGTLSVGMLIAVIQYINTALQPVQAMNQLYGHIVRSEVSMARIEAFLDSPVENLVDEETGNLPLYEERESAVIAKDLHVSYDGVQILNHIDLNIRKGQTVAFVGRSGSGKTTLFRTLLGFMPVQSGELYLNRIPHSHWSRPLIAAQVGVVFQESFLFKETLFENVALGREGADEEAVYRALCEAGLKEFVDSLPEGMYTPLDNQGFQLSGGQRQRVAIARAILGQPDVLILDEPTSALDRHTEEQVFESLYKAMEGKTTLIATHRLDTILACDVIYVMDKGKIIDYGTHEELFARCASYKLLIQKRRAEERKEQDEYVYETVNES